MDKKGALFLVNLFLILVFTINSSIAQTGKRSTSTSGGRTSISKTNNFSSQRLDLIEINGLKVENATPSIEFNLTEKRFSGNAGCNRMFGNFETNGDQIKFSGIGATKMFCSTEGVMKLEGDFIKALEKVTRFEQKGDALNLFAKNDLILKFSSTVKNVSNNGNSNTTNLENSKWVLTSIAGKKLPEAEPTPFLVFNKKESSAGGNSGCNEYGGKYKTEGDKISITKIISTMRACIEDDRMNTERELLDGLKQTNRFEIKVNKLNLYKNKRLLLTFDAAAKT